MMSTGLRTRAFPLLAALSMVVLPGCVGLSRHASALPAHGLILQGTSTTPCAGCDDLPYGELRIHLKPGRLATAADIERIQKGFDSVSGSMAIQVAFKSEAARKIQRATAERIGEPIAWVVDDEIVSVATVLAPFGEYVQITGLTAEECERYFTKMTGARVRSRR
jgi:hypothetical protein